MGLTLHLNLKAFGAFDAVMAGRDSTTGESKQADANRVGLLW